MDWLILNKDAISSIESIFTTIAIIIAGFWTYRIFVWRRQNYPKLNINHEVLQKDVINNKILIRIKVLLKNTGDILIRLKKADVRLNQILPIVDDIRGKIEGEEVLVEKGDTEILWLQIDRRVVSWKERKFEIEPGEEDEVHFDFIIDNIPETITIYSHFENSSKDRFRSFIKSFPLIGLIPFVKNWENIGWHRTTTYDITRKLNCTMEKDMAEDNKEDRSTSPQENRQGDAIRETGERITELNSANAQQHPKRLAEPLHNQREPNGPDRLYEQREPKRVAPPIKQPPKEGDKNEKK